MKSLLKTGSTFIFFSLSVLLLHTNIYANAIENPLISRMIADTPVKKGYAPVNGLKMYYEIYGSGQPLVLLHGGFSAIGTSFGELIPVLSPGRQLIAVEMQGHGRTADIDRPISYEALADDVAALLKYLNIPQADIFGYSVGGAVAIQLAIRHPATVRKLIITSASYSSDGLYPELTAGGGKITAAQLEGTPFKREYDSLAPHKEDFPKLVDKINALDAKKQDWSIQSIKVPCLVMVGDGDIIQPEHAIKMFRLLGGHGLADIIGLSATQLAILPGTSHISIVHRKDLIGIIVPSFLDAPLPLAKSK